MKKIVSMFLVVYLVVLNGPMTVFAAWEAPIVVQGNLTPQVFGTAVAVDGDNIIAVDPGEQIDDAVVVYFYKTDGTLKDTDITLPDSSMSVWGHTVDIDGDYAVVGLTDIGTAGSIRIYVTADGGETWDIDTTIACPGVVWTACGESVAISGDTIITGAPYADGTGTEVGVAYIYKLTTGTWGLEATIAPASTPATDDYGTFGYDVDISGEYAIIGAPAASVADYDEKGLVRLYKRTGTSWSQDGATLGGETDGDNFGWSVAIDGTTALIAANAYESWNYDGKVYFYDGPTTWTVSNSFTNEIGPSNEFGTHVDLSGDYAIVGELYGEPTASPGADSGAALVYKNSGGWALDDIFYADAADGDSNYGYSVAIDGDSTTKTAVVGQYNKPGVGDGGYIYIYTETATGGGAVPEFSDYMLMLVVVLALGFMIKTVPKISINPISRA